MAVFGIGAQRTNKVRLIQRAAGAEMSEPINAALQPTDAWSSRFSQFWDLMDTIKIHGYVRAAMSVIGRSTVGAWWSLRKHEEFGTQATERQRKRLIRFYLSPEKQWTNIKDFQSIAYKLMVGAMYLRYFGQVGFQILRNELGQPIGFDHLPGYIVPNVDDKGTFKSPAFFQYPSRNPKDRITFSSPRDIIFIVNPDFEGYPTGGADTASLTNFAFPLDIYLQTAAREYLKNRDKPEAFYLLSSDVSDEAFEDFVSALEEKYSGPSNIGKSPVAVKGDLEIKELRQLPSDLPYQQARDDVREELLAVSGTPGAKLGLTASMASANLREMRREFHEATMIPLFRLIEVALWEQLHVREMDAIGWEIRFNNPDFLNAVERATVHLRYKQMSVYSSNDIRYQLGDAPRKDELGDMFDDQLAQSKQSATPNPQGNAPEGRPVEPDAPSQTGEPNTDPPDPVRGDQHDEVSNVLMLQELRQWRSFSLRRVGKEARPFQTNYLPDVIRAAIQNDLMGMTTAEEIKGYFAEAEQIFLDSLVS